MIVHKNAEAFALGHCLLPIVLLLLYGHNPQIELLPIAALGLAYTVLLLWRAFHVKDLGQLLKLPGLAGLMAVDWLLVTASLTWPEWQNGLQPTWLLLFVIPLYASEAGFLATLVFGVLGMFSVFLYHWAAGTPFLTLDTLLLAFGMVLLNVFIGRVSYNLNRMAFFDTLTMLPNRELFKQRLNTLLHRMRTKPVPMAVFFLDLDKFKNVNDTMGHEIGDQLLRAVSERIGGKLPRGATFARMGGDEFALLTRFHRMEEVVALCKDIFNSLQESIVLNDQEVYISTSIGVAIFPEHGRTAEQLMKNADVAMYRAKEQGRNHYQFYSPPEGVQLPYERFAMEAMLRKALEKDELVVYYQPRVSARTEQLVCVEALVRWIHPELGLISPADFIPIAEETGLIVPLGELVLRKACYQVRKWQMMEGCSELRVSVNLSTLQFRQQNLPVLIHRLLRETKLSPEYLELEITESAAMQNVTKNILMLRDLKEMGVNISIDDFGTGYSSLSYLKRFPIDGLKIDRSFINGISEDPDDAAIVTAIIVLARTLKLKVTAEGVETEEQYMFLQQLGCDEIQGYLFGKPMPAKTLEDWLQLQMSDEKLVLSSI
ncbi:putative bifunctional diguanylate cyclase/phosphodiesterase [Paenibacillus koleovorans]|uniref:putative bifunctional diguanylate cyclase/phosphodiesterase n=1 Tax=Paenibacillus koleovorans TaxID=121608 RepID=UPI000FD70197|nr:EAL domain-containing protein [Paenibacillus koleovorans]